MNFQADCKNSRKWLSFIHLLFFFFNVSKNFPTFSEEIACTKKCFKHAQGFPNVQKDIIRWVAAHFPQLFMVRKPTWRFCIKTYYSTQILCSTVYSFSTRHLCNIELCSSVLSIDLRISGTSIENVTIAHGNQEPMGWSFNPHNLAMRPPTHEYGYSW